MVLAGLYSFRSFEVVLGWFIQLCSFFLMLFVLIFVQICCGWSSIIDFLNHKKIALPTLTTQCNQLNPFGRLLFHETDEDKPLWNEHEDHNRLGQINRRSHSDTLSLVVPVGGRIFLSKDISFQWTRFSPIVSNVMPPVMMIVSAIGPSLVGSPGKDWRKWLRGSDYYEGL